jgi:mRNA interferase RelE/StbE
MYRLRFPESTQKVFDGLDKSVSVRILRKLTWLAENAGKVQEEGLRGDLSRFSKLREGDYRILYEIVFEDKLIIVHEIGHRSEIYKR